jgi:hypothetical protein
MLDHLPHDRLAGCDADVRLSGMPVMRRSHDDNRSILKRDLAYTRLACINNQHDKSGAAVKEA